MPDGMPERARAAAIVALCLVLSQAAGAELGGEAQIRLRDGGTLDVQDVVSVQTGAEITAGDGSEIGALLLPGESIDLDGFGIAVVVEEGAADGSTGYPIGSRFEFSALEFGDPNVGIVDVSVQLDNVGFGEGSPGFSFTRDSVTLFVDDLAIGALPGAVDVGTLLLLLDVPEPNAATGAAFAAATLSLLRRRSATKGTAAPQ